MGHPLRALKRTDTVVAYFAVIAFVVACATMPRIFRQISAGTLAVGKSLLAREPADLVVAYFARMAFEIAGSAMLRMHLDIDARAPTVRENFRTA